MSTRDETHQGTTPSGVLPTDSFSVELRKLRDNPGAVRASSKVDRIDFYGRSETWIIDTFREEGGAETVFLQKMSAGEPLREVLPPEVVAVIARQHDRATTVNRRRGAQRAMATRRARGETLGNPEALRKAHAARRRAKKAEAR
jgi:hypothetical protein